ncbi:MAG: F0F1 ATP synthase subunit epsilon [Thermoflavifilum sp.]|nr:F0F1 ATP synthase subunit epsilon [Thermoflavifilum sp.]MCL6513194.1 F0F1 ATP synthase subunit epsilon [Alicyclobacillus sp.]
MLTVPLEVVTPDKVVLSEPVRMVIFRGGDGELGILPRHAPLATTLKPGVVKVRLEDGSEDFIAVTDGFVEVRPDKVTILANAAEVSHQIDTARAAAAKERAEARLAQRTEGVDVARAEAALRRAIHRLEAAELGARAGHPLAKRMTGEEV